jgi:hypothetical protein
MERQIVNAPGSSELKGSVSLWRRTSVLSRDGDHPFDHRESIQSASVPFLINAKAADVLSHTK